MDFFYIPAKSGDIKTKFNSEPFLKEFQKLKEKYGNDYIPILDDVEALLNKFQGIGNFPNDTNDVSDDSLDLSLTIKAQNIVKSFLKKRCFSHLASEFLISPLAKELGKRCEIWKDILHSETNYFKSLVTLYEVYYKPLKMRPNNLNSNYQKILTDRQINDIFQNVESIKGLAKLMYKKLEETSKGWPQKIPRIGGVFVSMQQDLRNIYSVYIRGSARAFKTLQKSRKNNSQFSEFLDRINQLDSSNSGSNTDFVLPISVLLVLPLQRIIQYEKYLKDILLVTPKDHVDYDDLCKALNEITKINNELSSTRNDAIRSQKIYAVNSLLKGPSVPDLLSISKMDVLRNYIREGPVFLVSDKSRKGYLYLFSDCLIISEIQNINEDKVYEDIIHFMNAEIKITVHYRPVILLLGSYLFCIRRNNRKFVFSTSTNAERESWITDISDQVNNCQHSKTKMETLSDDKSSNSSHPIINSDLLSPRPDFSKYDLLIQNTLFEKSLILQCIKLEEMISNIPKVSLIKGGEELLLECRSTYNDPLIEFSFDYVSGKVISTMPYQIDINSRIGDPVTDRLGFLMWSNNSMIVLASGHSGKPQIAAQAAQACVDETINYFYSQKSVPELRNMVTEIINAFSNANNSICAGENPIWQAGTACLFTGFLLEIKASHETHYRNYCFVTVSVGNAKAFHWDKTQKKLTSINSLSSDYVFFDPGGRLGPYIYEGGPDLRNFAINYKFCKKDDIIIVCSDGFHMNLDPEICGFTPKELINLLPVFEKNSLTIEQLQFDNWDQMDPQTALELKNFYQNYALERLISESKGQTPKNINHKLINYTFHISKSSREKIENFKSNSYLDLDHELFLNTKPNYKHNYRTYPGRMDHTSCITLQVDYQIS